MVIISGCGNKKDLEMSIIPKPVSLEMTSSDFRITSETGIEINNPDLLSAKKYLADGIKLISGIVISEEAPSLKVLLEIDKTLPDSIGDEGYLLSVGKDGISLRARSGAGVFCGVQTLIQSIDNDGYIPGMEITDFPRFAWRGFMLDVSRHFFPKEYIFKVIDYLALHKMNTLHLHLTDDQGWRIEIIKYTRLTEVGAWRVDREDQHWNAREKQKPGEKATYGGFYTQDDIREMVSYAESRFVTIVPEIEMPGHTTAALAAYPQYSCTGGPFTVLPGGVWPITDIYCAGKDETFEFLQNILDEVMELFPSKYIHIGGDEANKKEWEICPDCQRRIKTEGLANEHELQSYFIKRIEEYLNSKGRQLIGWDEILEGGLAPNASVMSWRGVQGGIAAARSGHPVVMSPTSHCYFDYYQGKPELEPLAIGGYLPLEKVYSFNPVPAELSKEEAEYINGVQANLWTEYVSTPEHADYMTFPRLAALAEVAWTPQDKRNFEDFASRLSSHLELLKKTGINYSRSFANVELETEFDKDSREFLIQLSNTLDFGIIRYTLDGSLPSSDSPVYTGPFKLNKTTIVNASTFLDGEPYSGVASEKVWIHKATGTPVDYLSNYSDKYSAGGNDALTNSLRGSVNLGDGRWQGYEGNDMEVVIDLGTETDINKVITGCLQTVGSWVFFPEVVSFFGSTDGKTFKALGTARNKISLKDPERKIQDFTIELSGEKARYIKVLAVNTGICPEWHSGAGEPAWLFVDEIIVE
jgi:hexosaminidase